MSRTLSDDVHLVIDTLGHVIEAHQGEAVFRGVETMRLAALAAREAGTAPAGESVRTTLSSAAAGFDPATALEVARAFTTYFQLVNLAEDAARVRELRRRERDGGPASVADSLHGAVAALAAEGASRDDVLAALADVRLTFVFTAHPTEARRQTTERLLADVARVLRRREREDLSPLEVAGTDRRLRAVIESLVEHAADREARPDVLDEVRAGLWYFKAVLLDVVPRFQRRLRHALIEAYGDLDPLALPLPVRFGSWMGGDRDGNPFVTAAVTEETVVLHRRLVLDRYEHDLRALVDPLAAVERRLPAHPDLDERLARAAEAVPELADEVTRRNPREPLRRLLTFAIERIRRARTGGSGGYAGAAEFLEDLATARDVLVRAGAVGLPDDALLDLILRVRCFGFHLAELDVREDSGVHRQAVAELLGDADYPSRPHETGAAALASLALPADRGRCSEPTRRTLDVFETMRRLHARFGPDGLHTYAISMTESATDVLEVLRLAELHGIDAWLDVVPLLETPDDLAGADRLLDTLFRDPGYSAHLDARGRTQELLVGYSDSMKRGGILASRVGVYEAQLAAAAACRRHGVRLRVFHGRGGSVSRGGGPTHRAIRALPPEAFSGEARITEQGEMRAHNFANPDLAVRYLEQSVGAALAVRCEAGSGSAPADAGHRETLARLAEASSARYRSLVEDEALPEYFRTATPFEQIVALNIASRPARRSEGTDGLAGLRAIPWVFAWSQSRHVLTGWFGVGSALEAADGDAVKTLFGESRFFRDLIDNVEMALAKTDLGIASRYAALCPDDSTRWIFSRITEEYDRTVAAVLRVTGRTELLGGDPVLARSIRLRNPYVDPLSYLQIEALKRLRAVDLSEEVRDAWSRVARVTIQGIAAGIRHTG